jgi:hypothetical protein
MYKTINLCKNNLKTNDWKGVLRVREGTNGVGAKDITGYRGIKGD